MIEVLVTSSVLILVLVVLRRALRGRLSLRVQYALWLLVAVRTVRSPFCQRRKAILTCL